MKWSLVLKYTKFAVIGGTVLIGIVLARPVWHLSSTYWNDEDTRVALAPGMLDDASGMNSVPMELAVIDEARFLQDLQELLKKAKEEKLTVSVAGARHSMGGHTLYPGGIAVDMSPYNHLEMLEDGTLQVGSGAKWSQIIPFLDQQGLSVSVMQSNHNFSVGGSLSVNCHGWQWNASPIASSVESFTLLLADGSICECNRKTNPDLFSATLGGYGLIGIILDVRLNVVENTELVRKQVVLPSQECADTINKLLAEDIELAYGRVSLSKDLFFEQILWSSFQKIGPATSSIGEQSNVALKRSVFRGTKGSDYGKKLRWKAEVYLKPIIEKESMSRNHLLSESATLYENRSSDSRDIIHEYFIPVAKVDTFLTEAKTIVAESDADLLNVTIRFVRKDDDTLLSYAENDRVAFVMLFNQLTGDEAEREMQQLTQKMIDLSLDIGGNYYLTYRPHATREQFQRAYPHWQKFLALKEQVDPTEIFQNQFYLNYLKQPTSPNKMKKVGLK